MLVIGDNSYESSGEITLVVNSDTEMSTKIVGWRIIYYNVWSFSTPQCSSNHDYIKLSKSIAPIVDWNIDPDDIWQYLNWKPYHCPTTPSIWLAPKNCSVLHTPMALQYTSFFCFGLSVVLCNLGNMLFYPYSDFPNSSLSSAYALHYTYSLWERFITLSDILFLSNSHDVLQFLEFFFFRGTFGSTII